MEKPVDVVIRIRPSQGTEPELCIKRVNERRIQVRNYRDEQSFLEYEFSKVHGMDASQKDIYNDSVKNKLANVFRGENVSIFAYGPTGAGKTHTIVGTNEKAGLIPRCMRILCKIASNPPEPQMKFTLKFSFLEIYQEKVYDLLEVKSRDLPIREDAKGNIVIPELAELSIKSFQDFWKKFNQATQNRTVAATKLNDRSSRSHAILIIKVIKEIDGKPHLSTAGKLCLIDLAGSEDNRKTGNTGVRLKESGKINSSLFCLGQVVEALNEKHLRIPYRDSKLTRLLQDSIGGSAHSLMIVNLAPESFTYFDTLNALKFASRTKTIVNKPFIQIFEDPRPQPNKRKMESEEDMSMKRKMEKLEGPVAKKMKQIADTMPPHNQASTSALLSPVRKRQDQLENKVRELEMLIKKSAKEGQIKPPVKPLVKPLAERCPNLPIGAVRPFVSTACKPVIGTTPVVKEKPKKSSIEHDDFTITLDSELRLKYEAELLKTLNGGTLKEIKALKNIGKKRAETIIAWRESNGPLTTLEDLLRCSFSNNVLSKFKRVQKPLNQIGQQWYRWIRPSKGRLNCWTKLEKCDNIGFLRKENLLCKFNIKMD